MYYDVKKTAGIIKELRKHKELTQEVAAEEMGINIKTYQAAEQGSRGLSIDTLCIIADYFMVTLDYLVTERREANEWSGLVENRTDEQKAQLFSIASNMISTLGWSNSHNDGVPLLLQIPKSKIYFYL